MEATKDIPLPAIIAGHVHKLQISEDLPPNWRGQIPVILDALGRG